MWRPPERIRHHPSGATWPTAEAASCSRLFSPISIGGMDFHQRTWVPAMVPWRASDDGYVTDAVIEWYARFAAGRPGAIVVEATGIRDIPSGPLLRIGHDRFIPGLKRLTAAVAAASEGRTRLLIQLIDFLNIRRRVSRAVYVERFLKINAHHKARTGRTAADDTGVKEALLALPEQDFAAILTARERDDYLMGYRERVTDTHIPQIAALPQILPGLFADAAARAQAAGFDGVELHYAHAYTMASFLSARNTREDGYGGTLANRMRLPLEVYNAVRQRLGGAFPVGCRYLAEECIEGGTPLSDACAMGVAFARAGLDYLSLSRGGKFEDASQPKIGAAAYPYTGPSGYECMPSFMSDSKGPFGRNVGPAGNIRKAIRDAGFNTPVVVAGGFHNFTAAEATLVAGHADIIGMARQSLADPDWPLKVQSGKGHEVRICEYSNYCEALDQKHVEVTCQLWDREDLGNDVRRSQDGKRRLTAPHWIRGA